VVDFLTSADQAQIISKCWNMSKEKILNSLDTWQKIWQEYRVKYSFLYDDLTRSIAFKFSEESGNFISQGFNLENILYIGALVSQFNKLPGIQKTLENFKHFPKFGSTLFEIVCANLINSNPNLKLIEFSPEIVKKNGKARVSDFKYLAGHSQEVIFAECKSLPNFQRVQLSNIKKLCEKLLLEFSKINKPSNLRVEISFDKLPEHWDKNLAEQMRVAIGTIIDQRVLFRDIQLNFTDIDSAINIYVCNKENKLRFSDSWIFAGDNRSQLLSNYFFSEASNTDNAIRRQIEDALDQMPEDAEKHIFIELLPGMDTNRATQIIQNKSLNNHTRISLYKEEALFNSENKNSWRHLYAKQAEETV